MAIVNRTMRVMHIISGDLWAGAETQAYTLLTQLHEHVCLRVVILNPGELENRLLQAKIPTVLLSESSLSTGQIFLRIVKEIYKFKPNVVHTHRQKENVLGGAAFALNRLIGRTGVSVRTTHGAAEFVPQGFGRIQAKLNLWVGRWIQQKIIAVSEGLRQQLLRDFGPRKLVVVHNGVDCHALQAQVKREVHQYKEFSIGIIGRLEPVKRVDIFLHMAALLLAQVPEIPWKFHIYGDGSLANSLKLLMRELNLDAYVEFHGQVSPVAPHLATLKAVVMCSDHEGTPMTALEALSLGVPVVAHRVGGLEELLIDAPQWLVDIHTPEGYAQILKNYSRNPMPPPSLPLAYTAQYNADQVRDLYQKLLVEMGDGAPLNF